MRGFVKIYSLFVSLIFAASCGMEETDVVSPQSGSGALEMTVKLSPTKASRSNTAADEIHSISIWICGKDNAEVWRYNHATVDSGNAELSIGNDRSTASLRLNEIPRGNCTIYVVANYSGLDVPKYGEGGTIDNDFIYALLDEVQDGQSPVSSGYIPYSAMTDFSISAGKNSLSINLTRCVGRLSIAVNNHIDGTSLFFNTIGLTAHNPSLGYLFHISDNPPVGTVNRSFRELSQMKRVDATASSPTIIYDYYLYETFPDIDPGTIKFSLFGAVYPETVTNDQVSVSLRNQYEYGTNSHPSSINTDKIYLINAASSVNYYMGDENGLILKFFSGDTELKYHNGIEHFFWRLEGETNSVKLTNVATNKQIKLEGSSASLVNTGNGTGFYYSSSEDGVSFSTNGYYLSAETDLHLSGVNSNSDRTRWYLREVNAIQGEQVYLFNGSSYDIPRVERPLTYIDRYGNTQNLTKIERNQHVEVVIGIYYNRELSQFDFSVEGWNLKESETTFD